MGIEFLAIAVVTAGLIAGLAALKDKQARRAEVRVRRNPTKR